MKVNLLKKIKSLPLVIRLLNWEYWPFHVVYSPIYPVWIWYCIKARSFFFFGASNPTIKNAGFLMEPKSEIDLLIPKKYKPFTLFFIAGTSFDKIKETVWNNNLQYPLVVKPDIGMQGKAVVKVNSDYELNNVIATFTVNLIIQSFIPYPKEVGIFYVRYPDDEHGKITGIVEKEFLSVTGDGISTIEILLYNTPRYVLQIPALKRLLGESINDILKKGENRILVPYGNHVRGSLFLDSTWKNSARLESVIDNACKSIEGFYFGRLDIRFNSFEELAEDKNWSIIELNGAGSEPTHMYDPKHSLFFAWKEIIRHWKILYKVSLQNKRRGFPFLKYKEGVAMFRQNSAYVKELNKIRFEKPTDIKTIHHKYAGPSLRVVK
ncbi:MAG: ATP-grasp domain-containing protein [Sediminibacterium magnilacihabitans]|jgi:hypothetical protein|nr:ATP-grasp domain-containing protein [Sediminibacterium magnilacihabitans]PQV62093.1 ATP-grasp domain-containing protein [Sediminibacterium magnilacihabitans]